MSDVRVGQSRIWWIALLMAVTMGSGLLPAQPLPDSEGVPQSRFRVTGTVRGPAGPAEGVRVILELRNMARRAPEHFAETRTDTEGYFEFDFTGRDFSRYGMQFNTVSRRFIETVKIIEVSRGELPYHVELEVQPGTVARGTVLDGDGAPLTGVRISSPGIRAQQSDSAGEWEVFGIPPGAAELRFEKEGYAPAFLPVRSQGPEIIEGFEVVLESARQLKGRVVNAFGEAVPYALLIFKDEERYYQQSADENGDFAIKGVPEKIEGMYLTAMAEGYLPTEQQLTAEDDAADEVEMLIREGSYLEGTVRLPSGEPAAGAIVVAGRNLSATAPKMSTDSDGFFRIGPFPPGQEVFSVLPPETGSRWGIADLLIEDYPRPNQFKGEVELWPQGFSSDFSIRQEGARIEMRRRDEGTGGFSTEVIYEGELDDSANGIKGTLRIPAMEQEGTFTMRASRRMPDSLIGEWELREQIGPSRLAIAPVQQEIPMPLLSGTIRQDFRFEPALALSGQALRADGTPFLDGEVQIVAWNDTAVFVPTTEIGLSGRFKFDRVPAGTFRVRAVSNDRRHVTAPEFARGGIEGLILYEEPPDDPMDD